MGTNKADVKELLWMVKRFLKYNILMSAISFIGIILNYLMPVVNISIMDQGIVAGDLPLFIRLIAVYFTLLLFSKLIFILTNYVSIYCNQKIELDLKRQIMDYFIELRGKDYGGLDSGELDTVLKKDISTIQSLVTGMPQSIFTNSVSFVIAVVLMINLQAELAGIIIVMQVFCVLIRLFVNKSIEKSNIENREAYVKFNATINEIILNIRSLKLLHSKNYSMRKFNTGIKEYFSKQKKSILLMQGISCVAAVFDELISLFILGIGGALVIRGGFTIGKLMGILQYSGRFATPLTQLASVTTEFSSKKAEISRITAILRAIRNNARKETEAVPADIHTIHFQNLNFTYQDGVEVFRDAQATFQKGGIYFLIGESGVGKSTLMKLLMGEYDVEPGALLFDGIDINHLTKNELSELITWIPQEPVLFQDTIYNNITLGNPFDQAQVEKVCDDCAIRRDINNLKDGFQSRMDERGLNISTGQKQRIAIARALLDIRPIIIIDEITSNLDTDTELVIKNNLHKYTKDKIVLIITHSLEFIMSDAAIYRLKDKQIFREK